MIGFNPYSLNAHQLQQSLAFQHINAGNAHFQQAGALLNNFQPALPCQPFMPGQMPPHLGCMPPPQPEFSNAPAGKGLTKNKDGSITTAGGYTIKPEGRSNAWNITGPDGKQLTRVWGDPHVDEADGTRWDFTKASDFVLPDGTRIHCKTTSETGKSVSKALTINNGNDLVQINGIDKNRPTTGEISNNGYEWRANHFSKHPSIDEFKLGGNGAKDVQWYKSTSGIHQGLITGAHYDGKTKQYQQKVDASKQYCVDESMKPQVGSPAWGNQLRSEMADLVSSMWIHPGLKHYIGQFLASDHLNSQLGAGAMGGLGHQFGGWNQANQALGNLGNFHQANSSANQSLMALRSTQFFA